MNIQFAINQSESQYLTDEVVLPGEFVTETDFADYLFSPHLVEQFDNLADLSLRELWLTQPNSIQNGNSPITSILDVARPDFAEAGSLDHAIPESKPAEKTQTAELSLPKEPNYENLALTIHRPQTKVADSAKTQLVKSVSHQTINAIENSLARSTTPSLQSITVEIYPRDLGQLNIQIEVLADSIQAKIVATENVSADLLNRNKDELVSALSDFGYSQTDVDISHHHSNSQQGQEPEQDHVPEMFFGQTVSPKIQIGKNPVMLVGINMVA